jgi:hypothetical protein
LAWGLLVFAAKIPFRQGADNAVAMTNVVIMNFVFMFSGEMD